MFLTVVPKKVPPPDNNTMPPIYLHDYLEHVFKIWHGFSTHVKRIFFCVRNFCRPPEISLWPEISVSEKQFEGQKSRQILHLRMFRSRNGSKNTSVAFGSLSRT